MTPVSMNRLLSAFGDAAGGIVVAKRLSRPQLESAKRRVVVGAETARHGHVKQIATFILVPGQRGQAALDAALAVAEIGPGGRADVGPEDRP